MSRANSDKIHTLSDDQLTRLLAVVDQAHERLEEFDNLSKSYESLSTSFDEARERLKILEDSRSAGPRVYASPYADNEARRRQACQWVVDAYGCDFVRDYKPTSGVPIVPRAGGDIQVGGVDADGGVTVPELVAPEIVRVIQKYGRAREMCRPFPMGSDTVNVPVRDTAGGKGVVVGWPGEGSAPTEDKEEFSKATLNAKKLVGLTQMSDELLKDSAVDFASYLLDVFGEALGREEDNQAFVATTPFTGIYALTTIATERTAASTFASLTYDDLVDLENAVDENLIGEGIFVLNAKVLKYVRLLKDQNDNPIWAPLAVGQPATILGRPYRVVNVMNKTDGADKVMIGYGDHRFHLFGTRDAQTVAFSSGNSGIGFKTATTWMRVMERIAFANTVAGAFGVLKTST